MGARSVKIVSTKVEWTHVRGGERVSSTEVDARFQDLSRRHALKLGALGLVGLSLPELLRAEVTPIQRVGGGRAKACILYCMEGGPAHQDLWDMKPDSPREYRGEFEPISTSVPGIHVCEHLPMLARQMHHVAQVRSVHHTINDHNAGTYYALTGRSPDEGNELIRAPGPKLFPTYGSVLAQLRPGGNALPDFVHLPEVLFNGGAELPGQYSGFLGSKFNPYVAGDPSLSDYTPPGLALSTSVTPQRFGRRQQLFSFLMDRATSDYGTNARFREMEGYHQKAFALLTSSAARRAFDLSEESVATRERYGFDHDADRSKRARQFGGVPHVGQSMLMARRLIEAGARLVTVCGGRRFCQAWDTHRTHFPLLKRSLLPLSDRAFSALLEDLDERGLLRDTLVVAMGEFGRTPRIGQITSSAGADAGGRDHWPDCYTVLFAGGGIRGGAVYGASDRYAAYPARDAVTPEDIAATIYYGLGIDPRTEIHDHLDRPLAVAVGEPIREIFG